MPPGVNFINVLQAAFTCTDPESAKRQSNQQLWGPASIKAVRKMLMKLTRLISLVAVN